MVTIEELREAAKEMGVDKGEHGFYEWQEEIIWDRTHKKILMNCGRKASKTTIVEARQAVRLLNDDIRASGVRGGMGLVGDEQEGAQLILQGVSDWLSVLGWEFTTDRAKKDAERKIAFMTKNEIQMPSGNRSLVITSKWGGRTMRKYSLHELDVDEADFIGNEFYAAVRYCLARFDGVELLESTPNILGDRQTHFAKGFFGVNPGYKVYHIPTTQVLHIDPEWLANEKKTKTAREWAREIMADYVSDISSVFPSHVLSGCLFQDIEWRADAAFIGAKYARFDAENSVIAENFHRDGISYVRVGLLPQAGKRIMDVENHIAMMVDQNGLISRVIIDNTSLGVAPIESMAQLIGSDMVVGVQNNEPLQEIEGVRRARQMKEELYVNALKLMERGLVKWEDRRIMEAFMDVRYEYSKKTRALFILGNDITDAVVRALFPVWGRREWMGPIDKKTFVFGEKSPKMTYN